MISCLNCFNCSSLTRRDVLTRLRVQFAAPYKCDCARCRASPRHARVLSRIVAQMNTHRRVADARSGCLSRVSRRAFSLISLSLSASPRPAREMARVYSTIYTYASSYGCANTLDKQELINHGEYTASCCLRSLRETLIGAS